MADGIGTLDNKTSVYLATNFPSPGGGFFIFMSRCNRYQWFCPWVHDFNQLISVFAESTSTLSPLEAFWIDKSIHIDIFLFGTLRNKLKCNNSLGKDTFCCFVFFTYPRKKIPAPHLYLCRAELCYLILTREQSGNWAKLDVQMEPHLIHGLVSRAEILIKLEV